MRVIYLNRKTLANFLVVSLIAFLLLGITRVAQAQELPTAKNVLLIVSDDLKASVLGCYGDPHCKTPNLDRLAERGVVFDHAYCQGVWCEPSRRSFMFSRYQGKSNLNLGQHFRNNGWYTARVGKIYHMRVPGDIIAGTNGNDVASSWTERFNSPGLEAHTPGDYACLNLGVFTDRLENRESTRMKHRMFVTVRYDGDGSDQPDHKSASKAIELMQTHQHDPFFLAVGFVRPHYPMVAPQQYFDNYPYQSLDLPEAVEDDEDDIPKLGLAGTRNSNNPIGKYPDNQRRMWTGYYASVEFMDAQVGRLLDELDRLGLTDDTVVVFVSDHGYHLGEHGFWQKSNLHEEAIRVPMIVAAPGFEASRSQSFVELVDLFPTFCELTRQSIPESVQGQSLVPVLTDPSSEVREGALSIHKGYSFRTHAWHYMQYTDGSEELYDIANDPKEFHNLAGQSAHQQKKLVLQRQLDKAVRELGLRSIVTRSAN